MIDLKNEIERLKLSDSFIIGEYSFGFTDGKNKGIKQVLELLDQYNIITAPKTIKLSEIVSKLETSFNYYCTQCRVLKEKDKTIIEYYNYSFIECEYEGYIVIKDNKIIDCDGKLSLEDNFKWLYALWIAGTIIEDDLKEE